jgi:NADP-dependent 3-hydroxy acid dehydrogenase YdfG
MTTLKDQVALVTGASGGIGSATALLLATKGVKLWLTGRDRARLDAVAESTKRTTSEPVCIQADLERDKDVSALATRLRRDVGYLDLLIHCAGKIVPGPMELAEIENLDQQYRVNVRGPYLLTQLLLPMLRSRRGQIVFINSSAGQLAPANASQYAATKHALRAIADSLRQEVSIDGIRVLSVYPGRTASPMQATLHAIERKEYCPDRLVQPEDVAAMLVSAITLPRSAEVTDINVRPLRSAQSLERERS